MRPRTPGAEAGATAMPDAERPALASRVTVDVPLENDAMWIVAHDGVPKARVSEPVARVARCFSGAATVAEIARGLGESWTPDDVVAVARRFDAAGLLRSEGAPNTTDATTRNRGRLRFRPPLTVQLSFGDPTALFGALRPVIRLVGGAPGMVVFVAVVLGGVVAAATGRTDVVRVLQQPVSIPVLAALGTAIVLTTLAHELGHGAALSALGGRPRRIGAMIFYLAPAFFCDVTDGWRLSRRRQRVLVALAGPAVHLFFAASSIIAARFAADAQVHSVLVLYALSCLVIALLNLLPFVQLDGYLALMAALDHPHLRRDAMEAATAAVAASLLGTRGSGSGRSERETSRHGGLVVYGIVCRLFPVLLVTVVLYRFATSVAGLGALPALAYLATVTLVLGVAARGLVRGVRRVAAARPRRLRTGVTVGVATTAVGAVLFLVPLSAVEQAGFVRQDEEVLLVASAAGPLPSAGTEVTLESNGILLRDHLGTARVGAGARADDTVDLAALIPLSPSGLSADASTIALVDVESAAALPRFGRARFDDPDVRTVGAWIWQTFLTRPIGALRSEDPA